MGLTDARGYNTVWDESKHHRGQPGNAGQFGPGGAAKEPPAWNPDPDDDDALAAGPPPAKDFAVAEEVERLLDFDLADPESNFDIPGIDNRAIDYAIAKGREVLSETPRPEAVALAAYADRGYHGVNAYLRGEPTFVMDGQRLNAADYSAAASAVRNVVAKAGPLPKPMHVYRGLEYPEAWEAAAARMEFDARVGKTFTLDGMVSTTYSAKYAVEFSARHGGAPLLFRIKAKTGLAGFNEDEFEVLQNHGTRYRVLGTSTSRNRGNMDLHVVDLEEVLPGEEGATAAPAQPPRQAAQAPARRATAIDVDRLTDLVASVAQGRVPASYALAKAKGLAGLTEAEAWALLSPAAAHVRRAYQGAR